MSIPDVHESPRPRALSGRVALVTRSTGGLGLVVARALAAAGADIVLSGAGRLEEIGAAQAALGCDFGVRSSYAGADLAATGVAGAAMRTILREHGRLDILVQLAGTGPAAEGGPAPAPGRLPGLARLALPLMRAGGFGRIIAVLPAGAGPVDPFQPPARRAITCHALLAPAASAPDEIAAAVVFLAGEALASAGFDRWLHERRAYFPAQG